MRPLHHSKGHDPGLDSLRRRNTDAAALRELLSQADEGGFSAWDGTVELTDEWGRRTAMAVHVPSRPAGRRLGALIVLHGAGGSGDQLLPRFAALGDRLSMAVLCPSAQLPKRTTANLDLAGLFGNRFRMPQWDMAGRDFPLAALRWARTELGVDSNRCALTGVSMGGLATWNLGMRFWHSFSAIAPVNGALSVWESFGTDRRARSLLPNVLPLPLFVVHGGKDEQIPARFDRESVRSLRALGHADACYVEVPDGQHRLETLGLEDGSGLFQRLECWLGGAKRATGSAVLRHRAEEDFHGRAHWVGISGITAHQAGEVRARRRPGNQVEIEVSGAAEVTLYLRSDQFRSGSEITVLVNGVSTSLRFEPDLATVFSSFREHADPELTAEQVLRIPVPSPYA